MIFLFSAFLALQQNVLFQKVWLFSLIQENPSKNKKESLSWSLHNIPTFPNGVLWAIGVLPSLKSKEPIQSK